MVERVQGREAAGNSRLEKTVVSVTHYDDMVVCACVCVSDGRTERTKDGSTTTTWVRLPITRDWNRDGPAGR